MFSLWDSKDCTFERNVEAMISGMAFWGDDHVVRSTKGNSST